MRRRTSVSAILVGLGLLGAVGVLALRTHRTPSGGLATNPALYPGSTLAKSAPNFRLRDQFGQPVSLRSYRGQVVLLAFIDDRCTNVCPLTTSAMLDAERLLGSASARVKLLAVNANPAATGVSAVRAYSQAHGTLSAWRFLTGSPAQLRRVWRAYDVAAEIARGEVSHTPALFAIDARGVERKVYLTQMNYTSVEQIGGVLAREAASLLPGHPAIQSTGSDAALPLHTPRMPAALPRADGGTVHLGPGAPRFVLFFDTWLSQLAPHLEALNRYQAAAAKDHLPALTAIDESTVEPSPGALAGFLHALPRALTYPVAIDRTGQIADGYEVKDEPQLEVISSSGRFLWYDNPSGAGWPSTSTLLRDVRAALARTPKTRTSKSSLTG